MSGKNWWNNAISGLESRLDTILAEDDQANAKAKAAGASPNQDTGEKVPVDKKLGVEQAGLSRNSSRSRPNSRLQDRLAKAVVKGSERADSRASSDLGARSESPAVQGSAINATADTGRTSVDSKASEQPTDAASAPKENTSSQAEESKREASPHPSADVNAPVASSPLASPSADPIVTEQPSMRVPAMSIPSVDTPRIASPRQSLDSNPARPSIDISPPPEQDASATRDPDILQTELSSLKETHEESLREHREELNSHLERIDALQSKLTYLSQQLATSAKTAAAEAEATPADKKLAEKDVQIAALMEEGQKLSKTEMKHLTTIKKMRAKGQEQDKEIKLLKQRLTKAEQGITEQSERAKRAEAAEKTSQEKLKIVSKIEKDIVAIQAEREEAGLTIAELRRQLNDALSRAKDAEKRVKAGSLEAEKRVTASLQEDIENIRIEKKIAEDRSKRELQAAQEEAKSQQEKANVVELELRGEIANLESKLELLRSRSEEATSSGTADSQAKLLRQIETLQTQYSVASDNWQGIETTLTSRVAALEKDRDETAKRESDIRRKARDVNSKARRLEDELESINERARALEQDLEGQRSSAQKLQSRLTQAETAAQDAQAELEREKKVWEAELQQRLEDERNRWRIDMQSQMPDAQQQHLRADSPSMTNRRPSPDALALLNRKLSRSISPSMEMPLSPLDRMLDEARRPPSSRQKSSSSAARTPEVGTPQRQNSIPFGMATFGGGGGGAAGPPYTPSIHAVDYDEGGFEAMSSPQRTVHDMVSVSTVGAGPSVQLVERMSAAVRRLESEKATSREEMARLGAQRDEARDEVVALMREVEDKKVLGERVDALERQLKDVDQRYQASLEMLGEKTEQVEELEGDVADLKKMYKELVSTMQ